nr:N-acetyllactosaminide beta-1,3-N-acetylglucosaminyltransferase 4-like [Lytechinus pictus]
MMKKMRLTQAIFPFFLGAIFMYSVQILYSYPSLDKYSSSRVRAIEEGYADRIPRGYGWKNHGRYRPWKDHPRDKVVDFGGARRKRSKFELMIDEAEQLMAQGTEKKMISGQNIEESKENTQHNLRDDHAERLLAQDVNKDNELVRDPETKRSENQPGLRKNEEEHQKIQVVKEKNIISVKYTETNDSKNDSQHILKDKRNIQHIPLQRNKTKHLPDESVKELVRHPETADCEKDTHSSHKDKNIVIYNKDITIPKHEHYVDEPADAHKYAYIHKPNVCSKVDGRRVRVLLIFMVTTSPKNLERRMLIRDTYGNRRRWPALSSGVFRTVFLLGAVENKTIQNSIHKESETYRDIIQEDFLDSYANLTLKTVMGLKWVANHCRHAKYTMKIDDDSMIHQARLLGLLKNATSVKFTAAESLMNAPVLRNTSSKYYVSETYYPAPTYPPYLNGPGYLISTDLTEGIYKVAIKTPLFPWEDVFLGICLKRLGVTPRHIPNFMYIVARSRELRNKKRAVNLFKSHTVVSNLRPTDMMLMWTTTRIRIKGNIKSNNNLIKS